MPAQALNGVVINEILADPTGPSFNFDTDGDGTARAGDEFVELFNTSADNTIDIGGWTLSDTAGATFAFPAGTTIGPESKVTVVTNYREQTVGQIREGFFEFDSAGVWDNRGDRIILSDATGNNSITAAYNGAALAGDEDFGDDNDGQSIQRTLDGADTFTVATPTPECFLTGTRILSESGYKLVEELKIGDKVQTADGEFADVKWIGYQTCEPGAVANPLRGNPILIKAGALGNSLPTQDLYLSPNHSLLIDGLLINAGALVNDISILKTEPTQTYVYHSVELENHALLTVEGTLAESYMPHKESRENYDNGAEYEQLYPNGSNLMLWPMDYPRISSKVQVPSFVSQKLLDIASSLERVALSA